MSLSCHSHSKGSTVTAGEWKTFQSEISYGSSKYLPITAAYFLKINTMQLYSKYAIIKLLKIVSSVQKKVRLEKLVSKK